MNFDAEWATATVQALKAQGVHFTDGLSNEFGIPRPHWPHLTPTMSCLDRPVRPLAREQRMTDSDDEIFEAEIAAELRKIRVLTRNEENELVRVATSNSAGAEQALRELERASIRLVLSIARNETNGRPLRHCYELGRRGWTEALGQFDLGPASNSQPTQRGTFESPFMRTQEASNNRLQTFDMHTDHL